MNITSYIVLKYLKLFCLVVNIGYVLYSPSMSIIQRERERERDNFAYFFLYLTDVCDLFDWVIFHSFVVVYWLFKLNFIKKKFRKTLIMSNGLGPDQERRSVGAASSPNRLQI